VLAAKKWGAADTLRSAPEATPVQSILSQAVL
jgi:hypothetical protein